MDWALTRDYSFCLFPHYELDEVDVGAHSHRRLSDLHLCSGSLSWVLETLGQHVYFMICVYLCIGRERAICRNGLQYRVVVLSQRFPRVRGRCTSRVDVHFNRKRERDIGTVTKLARSSRVYSYKLFSRHYLRHAFPFMPCSWVKRVRPLSGIVFSSSCTGLVYECCMIIVVMSYSVARRERYGRRVFCLFPSHAR